MKDKFLYPYLFR